MWPSVLIVLRRVHFYQKILSQVFETKNNPGVRSPPNPVIFLPVWLFDIFKI